MVRVAITRFDVNEPRTLHKQGRGKKCMGRPVFVVVHDNPLQIKYWKILTCMKWQNVNYYHGVLDNDICYFPHSLPRYHKTTHEYYNSSRVPMKYKLNNKGKKIDDISIASFSCRYLLQQKHRYLFLLHLYVYVISGNIT